MFIKREINIELTSEEVEQIFRTREKEYMIEDIGNFIEDMQERDVLTYLEHDIAVNTVGFIEKVISLYEKHRSCNVAYNDTMEEVIKLALKEGEGCQKTE